MADVCNAHAMPGLHSGADEGGGCWEAQRRLRAVKMLLNEVDMQSPRVQNAIRTVAASQSEALTRCA
jgi:hypothetical protein